jgi:hypothetical protein
MEERLRLTFPAGNKVWIRKSEVAVVHEEADEQEPAKTVVMTRSGGMYCVLEETRDIVVSLGWEIG